MYRQTPGHPDPGKLVPEVPEVPEDVPLDNEKPEEDARLIDLGMKRGLDEPATQTIGKQIARNIWPVAR